MSPLDFFKKLGNDIKKSNDKIAHDIKKSNDKIAHDIKNIPKPKIDMKALRTATGVIAGVVSLTPMGKALVGASVGISDKLTHGAGSAYLNNGHKTNSTLSLLPGGMLLQTIANESSKGKSGDVLAKYIPDPKKSAIHAITNKVNQNNIVAIKPSLLSPSPTKTTISKFTHPVVSIPKQNIFHNVIEKTIPIAPVLQSALHKISPPQKTVLSDTIIQKKTILQSIIPIVAPIVIPVKVLSSSLGAPIVPIKTMQPIMSSIHTKVFPHALFTSRIQETVLANKKTILQSIVSPIIIPISVLRSSLHTPVVPIKTMQPIMSSLHTKVIQTSSPTIPFQPIVSDLILPPSVSSSLPTIPFQPIAPDLILPPSVSSSLPVISPSLPMQTVIPTDVPFQKTTLSSLQETKVSPHAPSFNSGIQEQGSIGDYLPIVGLGILGLFFLL